MILDIERRTERGRKLFNIESDFMDNSYVVNVSRCGCGIQSKKELEQLRHENSFTQPRETRLNYPILIIYHRRRQHRPQIELHSRSLLLFYDRPDPCRPVIGDLRPPPPYHRNFVFSVDRPPSFVATSSQLQ